AVARTGTTEAALVLVTRTVDADGDPRRRWVLDAAPVAAGQPTRVERRPCDDAHAIAGAHTQYLAFDAAGEDRIGRLVAAEAHVTPPLRDPLRLDDLRGWKRATPDHAHLALVYEVTHGTERLVDVGQRVDAVDLVQVDVVRAEATQRIFAGADD